MKSMFLQIKERAQKGEDLVLVTVVASSGSTPRGAGARMLVGREGRICGTIGGGAVEFRAQQIAIEVLEKKASIQKEFSLNKNDVQNLGMICGGDVKVFFSYLPANETWVAGLAQKAEECYAQGKSLWLITDLKEAGRLGLYTSEDGFLYLDAPSWLCGRLDSRPEIVREEGEEFFVEQINSSGKVYIFGGGHVSQELVPVLAHVGFRCIVLENRSEFARRELFPDAEEVLLVDYDHLERFITVTPEDYACVMTRGHASDTVIQAQLLRTPACYIGVIGSVHKKAGVFQVLYSQGFTKEDTDRIVSPIGLAIKAETPAEIAISIAAQMIIHRAERKQG